MPQYTMQCKTWIVGVFNVCKNLQILGVYKIHCKKNMNQIDYV